MQHESGKSSLRRDANRIFTKLASGDGLNEGDVATVCTIIEASERQARRTAVLWVSLLVLMLLVIYATKWLAGLDNKNLNALLLAPVCALARGFQPRQHVAMVN